jgi:hypothetical protein
VYSHSCIQPVYNKDAAPLRFGIGVELYHLDSAGVLFAFIRVHSWPILLGSQKQEPRGTEPRLKGAALNTF